MKINFKDYRKGQLKAKVENLDDLWYLTYIIEKGDEIRSKTFRKIKLGEDTDRNIKVIKKPVNLNISVERIEFSKYTNVLRVLGTVSQGPEDIPIGSHHTISLEEGSEFSLQKKEFLKYQIEKVEESSKDVNHSIMIVVHDRDEAYFAQLKKYGYELLTKISGESKKKADVNTESKDFFPEIKKVILEYDKQKNFSNIIIASPGFWREYVQKIMPEEVKKKIIYATCSSASENGISEVIKRPEVKTVLREEKFATETKKVQQFLSEIAKEGNAEYGINNIANAINLGAVSELLVTDDMIHKRRQEGTFEEIESMMRSVEKMNGEISIISSEHESGRELDGLGGLGAILRYKLGR